MQEEGFRAFGPNFFVIGAQKAGTTRLCNLLHRHPQVAIPTKEPFFFQSPEAMEEKREWYEELFRGVAQFPARGEGSTYYSMRASYPGTAERIYHFQPEARVIYMVRHPLHRMESAWRHLLAVGQANMFQGFEHTLYRTPLLIDPTLYWEQISDYRRYFRDDHVHVVFFEEFIRDEAAEVSACLRFLGLSGPWAPATDDDEALNASEGRRRRLAAVDAVRAMPGYGRAKRFIPQGVKTLFSERVTLPVPKAPEWTPSMLEWVGSQLANDTQSFLRFAGRPEDYWGLPWTGPSV